MIKYLKCILPILIAILPFHLWADDKCVSNNCTLDADSVVLVYRLNSKPYSFYKFLITNNDIKIFNYVKVKMKYRHSYLFLDITTSQDLNDVDTYTLNNNLILSPTDFNEIKQNLFIDLNALYIKKTEDVIINTIKIPKSLQTIRVYSSEDIKTHKLSFEIYKNNHCETYTAISRGLFFNGNFEVLYYPIMGRPEEGYQIEYSPLFVDLYNLISSLTKKIPPSK